MARGDIKQATCVECGVRFEYEFVWTTRQLCDSYACHKLRKLRQNEESKERRKTGKISVNRRGVQIRSDVRVLPHERMPMRGGVLKKHDLQWMPIDDFARMVNKVLSGEVGCV